MGQSAELFDGLGGLRFAFHLFETTLNASIEGVDLVILALERLSLLSAHVAALCLVSEFPK